MFVDSFRICAKAFGYVALMFIIVFLVLSFQVILFIQLQGSMLKIIYLFIRMLTDLLFQKQLPMWSFNFFLGGNFLGAQNVYSVFNPFFLLTLPFSSSMLPKLYFPLLLLKTLLATWALSLYMRETRWFKAHTIIVASILYIFIMDGI